MTEITCLLKPGRKKTILFDYMFVSTIKMSFKRKRIKEKVLRN